METERIFREIAIRTARVFVALAAHTLMCLMMVASVYVVQILIDYLYGNRVVTIFGAIPITYLFTATDAAILVLFASFVVRDIVFYSTELSSKDDK